jgi:hypothetical protein
MNSKYRVYVNRYSKNQSGVAAFVFDCEFLLVPFNLLNSTVSTGSFHNNLFVTI